MNKASERYNTKVEVPISVILETIFSNDNEDVETLCRWAKHYGFVDLVKENENDKLGYYKLQDDYTKQSFYIWLNKEERKQYEYENHLLDRLEEKDKEIERLNNIIKEYKTNTIPTLEHNIDVLVDSEERLNNIIDELEKELLNKIDAVKNLKDTLGDGVYLINPHIDLLNQEYNYFLIKLKELKEGKE